MVYAGQIQQYCNSLAIFLSFVEFLLVFSSNSTTDVQVCIKNLPCHLNESIVIRRLESFQSCQNLFKVVGTFSVFVSQLWPKVAIAFLWVVLKHFGLFFIFTVLSHNAVIDVSEYNLCQ